MPIVTTPIGVIIHSHLVEQRRTSSQTAAALFENDDDEYDESILEDIITVGFGNDGKFMLYSTF